VATDDLEQDFLLYIHMRIGVNLAMTRKS
jgi:hypothetical protein